MDTSNRQDLQLRMIASAFVVGLRAAPILAGFLTLLAVAVVGFLEFRQVTSIQNRADATPVSPDDYPELHERTRKLATQLDVPMPTIALSDQSTPEALVAGFRASEATLVLSQGTLDALDDTDEAASESALREARATSRDESRCW